MVTVDGLGGAHRVLIPLRVSGSVGRPPGWRLYRDQHRDLSGELLDLARVIPEVVWVDAQEDHDRWRQGAGDVGDRADGAVGAE